jgi:hypothetical protein
MSCGKCHHLKELFRIRLPSDFKQALKIIRDSLKADVLKLSYYWPKDKAFIEMPPFEKEDWGDYILYYFECSTCNQLFEFSVETYHGSGGILKPVDAVKAN